MVRKIPKLRHPIHQPLPLSTRDAHKLLGIWTKSFRGHLETEHGTTDSPLRKPLPGLDKSKKQNGLAAETASSSFQHPNTDRHFQAILENPLFQPLEVRRVFRTVTPLQVFTREVAKGTMDFTKAANFLYAIRAGILNSHVTDIRKGMKDSGAGFTVLQWLKSSGNANDLEFFKHRPFSKILVQFLVAEGLHDVAWSWAKTGFDRVELLRLPGVSPWSRYRELSSQLGEHNLDYSLRYPFLSLIEAEVRTGASIDRGCFWLAEASAYLETHQFTVGEKRLLLRSAQNCIVEGHLQYHSTVAPVSESAFNTLLNTLPNPLPNGLQGPSKYQAQHAHLLLLHPTRPSPESALSLLSTWREAVGSANSKIDLDSKSNARISTAIIRLSLDLTKILLEQNRISEADGVIGFLRGNFSEQLGEAGGKTLEDTAAESKSIGMLGEIDGLGLA